MVSAALRFSSVSAGKAARSSDAREVARLLRPTGVPLVRIGADHDGGYLVPDDLDGIEACFSPGVAEEASFESCLADRGIPTFMIDGSVAHPPIDHQLFHFESLYLDVVSTENSVTLQEWVTRCWSSEGDLLLQMDIEGSEWAAILDAPDAVLQRFRIIVLELHEFEKVFDLFGVRVIRAMLQKLLKNFVVVHVHPNNYGGQISNGDVVVPQVPEITLLRKDRLEELANCEIVLPHRLDSPNSAHNADITLSRDIAG